LNFKFRHYKIEIAYSEMYDKNVDDNKHKNYEEFIEYYKVEIQEIGRTPL